MISYKIVESMSTRARRDFESFRRVYQQFRVYCKLKAVKHPYEVVTAMTDKLGRVAREIKHLERKDPRPDALDSIRSGLAGIVIYALMLEAKYGCSIAAGIESELREANRQHGNGRSIKTNKVKKGRR